MLCRFIGGPYDGETLDVVPGSPTVRVVHRSNEPIFYGAFPRRPRFPWARPWRVRSWLRAVARWRDDVVEYDATLAEAVEVTTSVYRAERWTHRPSIVEIVDVEQDGSVPVLQGEREIFFVHETIPNDKIQSLNPCNRGCCK